MKSLHQFAISLVCVLGSGTAFGQGLGASSSVASALRATPSGCSAGPPQQIGKGFLGPTLNMDCQALGFPNLTGLLAPGQLPTAPGTAQTLATAGDTLTVPTDSIVKTFKLTGSSVVWNLTATPTVAIAGVPPGRWLLLLNTDPVTGNCAVFQDKAALPGSVLSLQGTSRTLCGGDPGLWLYYDGTNWTAAVGGVELFEGTSPPQDKRMINSLFYDTTDFNITYVPGLGNVIALGNSIPHLGNTIDPSETSAGISPDTRNFAFTGAINSFMGFLQTFGAFVYKNLANVTNFECGNTTDGACGYSGLFTSANHLATKGKLDAHITLPLDGYYDAPINTLGVGTVYLLNNATSTNELLAKAPVPYACVAQAATVYVAPVGSFDGNVTLTVSLRKNGTNLFSLVFTNATAAIQTSATTGSYNAASDFYSWAVTCSGGGCTSSSTRYAVRAKAVCIAG